MWDIEFVGMKYPTDYFESGNTVLVQETQRYNNLLALMKKTLAELQKALKVGGVPS
jgi:dynein heavy chain, axonemal